jgi:hypothetical protein
MLMLGKDGGVLLWGSEAKTRERVVESQHDEFEWGPRQGTRSSSERESKYHVTRESLAFYSFVVICSVSGARSCFMSLVVFVLCLWGELIIYEHTHPFLLAHLSRPAAGARSVPACSVFAALCPEVLSWVQPRLPH